MSIVGINVTPDNNFHSTLHIEQSSYANQIKSVIESDFYAERTKLSEQVTVKIDKLPKTVIDDLNKEIAVDLSAKQYSSSPVTKYIKESLLSSVTPHSVDYPDTREKVTATLCKTVLGKDFKIGEGDAVFVLKVVKYFLNKHLDEESIAVYKTCALAQVENFTEYFSECIDSVIDEINKPVETEFEKIHNQAWENARKRNVEEALEYVHGKDFASFDEAIDNITGDLKLTDEEWNNIYMKFARSLPANVMNEVGRYLTNYKSFKAFIIANDDVHRWNLSRTTIVSNFLFQLKMQKKLTNEDMLHIMKTIGMIITNSSFSFSEYEDLYKEHAAQINQRVNSDPAFKNAWEKIQRVRLERKIKLFLSRIDISDAVLPAIAVEEWQEYKNALTLPMIKKLTSKEKAKLISYSLALENDPSFLKLLVPFDIQEA